MQATPAPPASPQPTAGDGEPPAGRPAPGELNIKFQRSWKTWQLLSAALVAMLIGMAITYSTNGSSSGSASASSQNAPLPAEASNTPVTSAGATPTTVSTPTTAAGAGTSPSTTAPSGSTSSTTGSSSTSSSTSVAGQSVVLLPARQATGNWTSPTFTVGGGTWNIGWAYECTPAPAAGPGFRVFVIPQGGSAGATPAVSETPASGSGVTPQTTAGAQELEVEAPPTCTWAVKVTGIA